MSRPTWNAWTAITALGMFAASAYVMKLGQWETGAMMFAAAMTFCGVTESKKKP